MKTNVKPEDRSGRSACKLSKKDPADCITEEPEMEEWWDRRGGGWSPDKIDE
jgi:hypothetical protein